MTSCGVGTKVCLFLAGVGIGACVAMLVTPRSGQQTRKLIAKKVGQGKDFVATKGKEIFDNAGERLAGTLESGVNVAKETFLKQ